MEFNELSSLVNIYMFLIRWRWRSWPMCNELRPPGVPYLYVPLEPPGYDRASIRIT